MPKKQVSSAKKSKASKEKLNRQMRVTIYFGYGLFLLTLIALVASTLPLFTLYANPLWQEFDITLLLVSFAFTSLAPPLVGYLAGDAATRGTSRLVHHYNGVLFGVLGVWLWLTFATLTNIFQWTVAVDSNFQYSLLTMAPAIASALVTTVLGVAYARSTRHQRTLIDYKPYRLTLFASVVGIIAALGVSSLFSLQYGSNIYMTFLINVVIPLLFVLIATLGGYWILGKKTGTEGERVVYSLVASGFGIVSVILIGQFAVSMAPHLYEIIGYGYILVLLVWVMYLYLLRRASR